MSCSRLCNQHKIVPLFLVDYVDIFSVCEVATQKLLWLLEQTCYDAVEERLVSSCVI
jgi:hypothetical protein